MTKSELNAFRSELRERLPVMRLSGRNLADLLSDEQLEDMAATPTLDEMGWNLGLAAHRVSK